MITFNTTQNGIDILYKNQIIIQHTKSKPAFFLGSGVESIES